MRNMGYGLLFGLVGFTGTPVGYFFSLEVIERRSLFLVILFMRHVIEYGFGSLLDCIL